MTFEIHKSFKEGVKHFSPTRCSEPSSPSVATATCAGQTHTPQSASSESRLLSQLFTILHKGLEVQRRCSCVPSTRDHWEERRTTPSAALVGDEHLQSSTVGGGFQPPRFTEGPIDLFTDVALDLFLLRQVTAVVRHRLQTKARSGFSITAMRKGELAREAKTCDNRRPTHASGFRPSLRRLKNFCGFASPDGAGQFRLRCDALF